jgi:hypothetical protein
MLATVCAILVFEPHNRVAKLTPLVSRRCACRAGYAAQILIAVFVNDWGEQEMNVLITDSERLALVPIVPIKQSIHIVIHAVALEYIIDLDDFCDDYAAA